MTTYKVALENLVKKLEDIEKNDSFKGVWVMAHVHGYVYTGPSWTFELEAAQALLTQPAPEAPMKDENES